MALCNISSRLSTVTILALFAVIGCANGEQPGASAGTGGSTGSGGNGTPAGSGGSGTSTGSGGATVTGSGGAAATATGGRTVTPSRLTLPWMEDFEGNAVGPTATGWIKHPKDTTGVWAVVTDGTKVLQQQNAAAGLAMMVGGDVGWTNFKVEAKVKIATASSDVLAILSARYADPTNYYFLHLKGDGSIKIRKRIDDSTADVLTYKSATALVAGTWYTIAFGFQGSTVTAYLNGAMVATMTEAPASILAGGIGLGAQDGAVSFDDVKVTAQ